MPKKIKKIGKVKPQTTVKAASKPPVTARAAKKVEPKKVVVKKVVDKPAPAQKEKKSASPSSTSSQKNIESNLVAAAPEFSGKEMNSFFKAQKQKLLALRDTMVDAMTGVAKDTLRSRAEGSEASAFGMHQADAGSDSYDRDFALNLLSQEQDALYEIEEALKRIENGTYGVCEMSNKKIPRERLEAIPFARYTVECQSQLEKNKKQFGSRPTVTSLFGLTDDDDDDDDDEI